MALLVERDRRLVIDRKLVAGAGGSFGTIWAPTVEL